MEGKICGVCNKRYIRKYNNQKYCSKRCSEIKIKEKRKKWLKEHKEEKKELNKNYKEEHKEETKEYEKKYRKNPKRIKYMNIFINKPENKKRKAEYIKKWEEENKEKRREYSKKRSRKLGKDPIYRINHNMSGSIYHALKSKGLSKNRIHWEDIVGYTKEQLKKHLEKQFLPGMSWDNKGRNGWHLDHIIPITFFKYTSMEDVEFRYCWSLDNLQPLWESDNIRKGNKIVWQKK